MTTELRPSPYLNRNGEGKKRCAIPDCKNGNKYKKYRFETHNQDLYYVCSDCIKKIGSKSLVQQQLDRIPLPKIFPLQQKNPSQIQDLKDNHVCKDKTPLANLKALSKDCGVDPWIAYRGKDLSWSKWQKLSQWTHPFDPNYRQILPAEIIWESDKTKEENEILTIETTNKLQIKGINYSCYFSGGKSYHTHAFFPELADIPDKLRPTAKKLLTINLLGEDLAKQLDSTNFGNKRLILIEGAAHPKTGVKKTLYNEHFPKKNNALPKEVLEQIKILPIYAAPTTAPAPFVPAKCPFIEYACTNRLPVSSRNTQLVPNVVALTADKNIWQRCADAQEKKLIEFENWAKRNPRFCCAQLQSYAKTVELKIICDLCLLEGCYGRV